MACVFIESHESTCETVIRNGHISDLKIDLLKPFVWKYIKLFKKNYNLYIYIKKGYTLYRSLYKNKGTVCHFRSRSSAWETNESCYKYIEPSLSLHPALSFPPEFETFSFVFNRKKKKKRPESENFVVPHHGNVRIWIRVFYDIFLRIVRDPGRRLPALHTDARASGSLGLVGSD